MKKTVLLYFIFFILVIGVISNTSCKRRSSQDPAFGGPAGFRIILSGTANPSTLYIPTSDYSHITVTALNNDGTPASGRDIVLQVDKYGYIGSYQITEIHRTNDRGVVTTRFTIPPASCVRGTVDTEIKATLVDDGRLDNIHAEISDYIPIKIIHDSDRVNITIHGNVYTPSGEGIGEIPIVLESSNSNESGVTVTRPSGSYEFYVTRGWTGSVTPDSENFEFIPADYTFTVPLSEDQYFVDFIATFSGTEALAVDITSWDVGAEGGTQVVNVYNISGDFSISYILIPSHNWIHVSPSSGVTPGSFVITVDENTTGAARTGGTVTIIATDPQGSGELTVTINQDGFEVPGNATLAVDRSTLDIEGAGNVGSPETVNVYNSTSSDAIAFIVTTNDSWLTVSATSGTTNTTLDITAEENIGAARTGTITLTSTSTGVNQTVTITVNQEAGASIAVDVISRNVVAAGENFIVNVTNPTSSDTLTYEITNPDSWATASPTTGTTPGQNTIIINANVTGVSRTAVYTFTVTSTIGNGATATLIINQDG